MPEELRFARGIALNTFIKLIFSIPWEIFYSLGL